jgi:hypothetical protein
MAMKNYIGLLFFILLVSCTKDREFLLKPIQQPDPIGDFYLLHYWNFNNAKNDLTLIAPSFTINEASMSYAGAFYDPFEEGSNLNARAGDIPGTSLRLRNPAGDWVTAFSSKGYANLKISFAAQRSGNGARTHQYEYSLDGVTYKDIGINPNQATISGSWQLFTIELFEVEEVNNQDRVYFKVKFSDNADNPTGNNRIDNFTIEGTLPGVVIDPGNNTGGMEELIHYWHFNNLVTPMDVKEVEADFVTGNLPLGKITYTGSSNRDMDEVEPGTLLNARQGQLEGKGLRVRNRSEGRTLIIQASSLGFKDLKLSYAVQRSGSGMLFNDIQYSLDGTTFTSTGLSNSRAIIAEEWQVFEFDLTPIPAVNNNPNFMIRISFEGNTQIDNGNNRYDNVAIVGKSI